jgi:hypothetical protein
VPSKLSVNVAAASSEPFDGYEVPEALGDMHLHGGGGGGQGLDTGSSASLPLDSFSAMALGRKRGAASPKQVPAKG